MKYILIMSLFLLNCNVYKTKIIYKGEREIDYEFIIEHKLQLNNLIQKTFQNKSKTVYFEIDPFIVNKNSDGIYIYRYRLDSQFSGRLVNANGHYKKYFFFLLENDKIYNLSKMKKDKMNYLKNNHKLIFNSLNQDELKKYYTEIITGYILF